MRAEEDQVAWTFKRVAARAVLLDRSGFVYLIHGRDPGDASKGTWWEIPGGGIDPGETSLEAARREVVEESGIHDIEMGPCIWTQHVEYDFAGYHFDQDEYIHVAWADQASVVGAKHLEALEALAFMESRWWTLEDLLAAEIQTLPTRMREFLPDLMDGRIPETPLDITGPSLGD
ncbi:MAG: NUDIX domain-containing protein [Actinomycetia bacterium]|nr:NUDIX domain-containing protein [Actinomycetes bacterium]